MMLRKRTWSHQKDQMASGSDHISRFNFARRGNHNSCSYYSIPCVFVGMNKDQSYYDPIWSPTSPLEFAGNHLTNAEMVQESTSLPKGHVVFEIGDKPVDSKQLAENVRSCSMVSPMPRQAHPNLVTQETSSSLLNHYLKNTVLESRNSTGRFTEAFPAIDIELSEDYTRVVSHSPSPKATHIYGESISDDQSDSCNGFDGKQEKIISPAAIKLTAGMCDSDDFSILCQACNKKLEEAKDIYIYRGERSFCSIECRLQQILIDEEIEEEDQKFLQNSGKEDEVFENGVVFTTRNSVEAYDHLFLKSCRHDWRPRMNPFLLGFQTANWNLF